MKLSVGISLKFPSSKQHAVILLLGSTSAKIAPFSASSALALVPGAAAPRCSRIARRAAYADGSRRWCRTGNTGGSAVHPGNAQPRAGDSACSGKPWRTRGWRGPRPRLQRCRRGRARPVVAGGAGFKERVRRAAARASPGLRGQEDGEGRRQAEEKEEDEEPEGLVERAPPAARRRAAAS